MYSYNILNPFGACVECNYPVLLDGSFHQGIIFINGYPINCSQNGKTICDDMNIYPIGFTTFTIYEKEPDIKKLQDNILKEYER